MTQKQLLKLLGLTSEEFRDLLQKFADFQKSLNPAQRDAVERSMPTIAQARRSLGGDLTPEQLLDLVRKIQGVHVDDAEGGGFGSKIYKAKPNPTGR